MAIARTFAETCDGAQVNEGYLEDLRRRLHVVESDHPRFAAQARSVVDALKTGLSQAPSRKDWCDNLIVLYGPAGTMIPDLLKRP